MLSKGKYLLDFFHQMTLSKTFEMLPFFSLIRNDQNLTTVTSNMNNSSDTSDYDDAVDNLTDE